MSEETTIVAICPVSGHMETFTPNGIQMGAEGEVVCGLWTCQEGYTVGDNTIAAANAEGGKK